MKYFKKIISFLIVLCIIIISLPIVPAQAKVKALSGSDFKYSGDNKDACGGDLKKYNDKQYPDSWLSAWTYEKGVDKSPETVLVTNRNINFSSTKNDVLKAYGKGKIVKINLKKDKMYKNMKHDKAPIATYYENSTAYVYYTYKEDDNTYGIRFYFNKEDKIEIIMYYKNIN